jgi:hypothetical protein
MRHGPKDMTRHGQIISLCGELHRDGEVMLGESGASVSASAPLVDPREDRCHLANGLKITAADAPGAGGSAGGAASGHLRPPWFARHCERSHRVSSGCKNASAFHVDVNFSEIGQSDQGIHTPVHRIA